MNLDNVPSRVIAELWEEFIRSESLVSATKYLSPKLVARLVRKRYNKTRDARKPKVYAIDRNDRSPNFVLSVGAPNYLEREFIKDCNKAGEPFPVRKIQLRYIKKK